MRASALLLVLLVGCETPKVEVEPVMKMVEDLDQPYEIEVVGAVGIGTVEVPIRLSNSYGAAIPGGQVTVSVDGASAALAATSIQVDDSGYGTAVVSVDGAETFTVSIVSTDMGLAGGATGTGWGVAADAPALDIEVGLNLPDDAQEPDFFASGTGGFAAARDNMVWYVPAASGHPAHLVAALPFPVEGMWSVNLDTDGVADLVLWGDDQAVLLRGRDGGGYSWGAAWQADAGEVVGVGVDDLDGDRLPDIAIGMSTDESGNVQILSGDGAWNFEPSDALDLNFEIMGLAVADEGDDGTAEVTVLATSTGYLRRYTQSEEGWIGATGPELGEGFLTEFAGAEGAVLMPATDLNDDGDEDYVLVSPAGTSQVIKFLTIQDDVTYYTLDHNQANPALGDLNGTSPVEMVVLDAEGGSVLTFQGAGSDPQYRERSISLGTTPAPIALLDTDGDDVTDVGVASGIVQIYPGSLEEGEWQNQDRTWRAYDANLDGPLVYGDFNEDGLVDFASLSSDSGSATLELWFFSVATGDVKLVSGDELDLDGLESSSLAMCEEDGDLIFYAIVTSGSTDKLHRLRYEPGSTDLTLEASSTVAGTHVGCGDFGSGVVAVANSAGAWSAYYYNEATGSFTSTTESGTLGSVYAVTTADTDGDGTTEMVGCSDSGCTVTAGDIDGDGADEVVTGGASLSLLDDGQSSLLDGAGAVSLVDADGDGMLDVLAVDADEGRVYLLRGGAGGVAPPVLMHTTRELGGVGTLGDVSGDGLPELVVEGTDGAIIHTDAE